MSPTEAHHGITFPGVGGVSMQPMPADKTICDLLIKRAKFIPAVDSDGKAATAVFPLAMSWHPTRTQIFLPPPMIDLVVALAATPPKPVGNPADWFSSQDYPMAAMRRGSAGTTYFTLTIDAAGAPIRCEINGTSHDPDLDQATCDVILRHARFVPAKDPQGKPTIGKYVSSIRWQVPTAEMKIPVPFAYHASFDVMPDGTVQNCRNSREGRLPPGIFYSACQGPMWQVAPQTDASGKPVKRHFEIEARVSQYDAP